MFYNTMKLRKKVIGYIPNDQLHSERGVFLPRIGGRCETCSENKGFTLVVERYTLLPASDDKYYLQCDTCVERIGLDNTEVTKIEGLAKLNMKLKLKKISNEKYEAKIEKIMSKK